MMSELQSYEHYTAKEIEKAKTISSAINRYLVIVQSETTTQSTDDFMKLRIDRHKYWITSALSVVLKKNTPREICEYWSTSADEIVSRAWRLCGCANFKMALFALGKWGSQELNLSSDIDIMVVSSENATSEELHSIRKFINVLSEMNSFGFCFRVDTDLKPGGRFAPLICSLQQIEEYYWSSGATWERLALVRLRAVVGDAHVISAAAEIIEKFVFRRHIDYSLLEDLKHLRTQIHHHNAQINSDIVNLKLSAGGIRDIELFIHALQVIHGGKIKALRTTSTSKAAELLVQEGRFDSHEMHELIKCYWYFRDLENYVQALDDQQTHDWNKIIHGDIPSQFVAKSAQVNQTVEGLIGKPSQMIQMSTNESDLKDWLHVLDYKSESAQTSIRELLQLTAQSTRTYQDEQLRLRVLRLFILKLADKALDKDLGIALLVDFFKSTRAKTAFFSLLLHEDRLIDELCMLFGCSPYLGGILASRPELLDSYLYRAQAAISINFETALEELTERKLLNEIISANQFLMNQSLTQLCSSLSSSADEICTLILDLLKKKFGPSTIQILALGKWGGHELGLKSDLDFIFYTENLPQANDQKIARRFLSRLTEQHKGGSIYAIDMRLRPTGKAGPILVSKTQLLTYLKSTAEVWERQSYLRSRRVGGSDTHFLDAIYSACVERKINSTDWDKLKHIRSSLLKPSTQKIEFKYDEGGLIDIEFAVQISVIHQQLKDRSNHTPEMISLLEKNQIAWSKHRASLVKNYQYLRTIEQLSQLTTLHPSSSIDILNPGFIRVAKLLNIAPDDLKIKISCALSENSEILKKLDLRQSQT